MIAYMPPPTAPLPLTTPLPPLPTVEDAGNKTIQATGKRMKVVVVEAGCVYAWLLSLLFLNCAQQASYKLGLTSYYNNWQF